MKIIKRYRLLDFLTLAFYLLAPFAFFLGGWDPRYTPISQGDPFISGLPVLIYSRGLNIWNPHVLNGAFSSTLLGWQTFYPPGMLVMNLFPNVFGYTVLQLLHYSLAGLFTFLFLRKLNLKYPAAFVGSISFMFCGFLTAHRGHSTMMIASSYLPVVLYFFESFIKDRKLLSLLGAGIAFGLSILADYMASPMYIGIVVFPYLIFRSAFCEDVEDVRWKRKLAWVITSALVIFGFGLLVSAIKLVPLAEAFSTFTRENVSYRFFASFSFPTHMLPVLIFPYFFGTQAVNQLYPTGYFGSWNLTELAGYMGILPLLSAVLAFLCFRNKNRQIYFWAGLAVVTFVLALGISTPFYKWLYYVPIYNLFRVPARNWLEVNFAVSVLCAFCLHEASDLDSSEKKAFRKTLFIVLAIFAITFVTIATSPDYFGTNEYEIASLVKNKLSTGVIYIPLGIAALSCAALWLFSLKTFRTIYWAGIAGILLIDLYSFGHFHDVSSTKLKIFDGRSNAAADYMIQASPDQQTYRIWTTNIEGEDNLSPNIHILYGFNSISAYTASMTKGYQALTGMDEYGQSRYERNLISSNKVLSLLSTRYLVTSNAADKEFISSVQATGQVTPARKISNGFQDPAWAFVTSQKTDVDTIALASKNGQLSLAQLSFKPHPDKRYIVVFQVRMNKGNHTKDGLFVDFKGENFEFKEQEKEFLPETIGERFEQRQMSFYVGSEVSETLLLRLFTFSEAPYQVKNIKLYEGDPTALYWGSQPSPGNGIQLYPERFESPEGVAVFENLNVLPRARFVTHVTKVQDTTQAADVLWTEDEFDPSTTALVEGSVSQSQYEPGEVLVVDYSKPSSVKLNVRSGDKSFLVLADTWYPGWKAYVDGKETPIYRTYAVLRGIEISGAGEHQVVFKFVPLSFYIGLAVTCLALIGSLGVVWYAGKQLNALLFGPSSQPSQPADEI